MMDVSCSAARQLVDGGWREAGVMRRMALPLLAFSQIRVNVPELDTALLNVATSTSMS